MQKKIIIGLKIKKIEKTKRGRKKKKENSTELQKFNLEVEAYQFSSLSHV